MTAAEIYEEARYAWVDAVSWLHGACDKAGPGDQDVEARGDKGGAGSGIENLGGRKNDGVVPNVWDEVETETFKPGAEGEDEEYRKLMQAARGKNQGESEGRIKGTPGGLEGAGPTRLTVLRKVSAGGPQELAPWTQAPGSTGKGGGTKSAKEFFQEKVRKAEEEESRRLQDKSAKRERSRSRKERKDHKKRSHRRADSSSGSDSSCSGSEQLFRDAPSGKMTLAEYAKKNKGALLVAGLKEMAKYLPGPGGAVEASWETVKVRNYLNQVLFVQTPPKDLGLRNVREFQTMALILDSLIEGDVAGAADVAMQRMKAMEAAVQHGSWAVAKHHELLPQTQATLIPVEEATHVEKAERRAQKLSEGLEKAKSWGSGRKGPSGLHQ